MITHERGTKDYEWAFLPGIDAAVKKSGCQCKPRSWSQIVLIINLRPFEERACRANKSVFVWIIDLPLVIITENEFMLPPLGCIPIDVRPDQPTFSEEVINGAGIENRVGISGVAHGVSKQTADAQCFVRRPANVGDRSGVAVIVVWTRVLGIETTHAD